MKKRKQFEDGVDPSYARGAVKQLVKIEKEYDMIEKNEIKKALYKQKPIAEYGYDKDKHAIYSTEIVVDGTEEEITFKIPMDEVYDGEGNKIFRNEEPAQLLIRWLSID